ncbi:MAG: Planctomycete cytochrome [Planctomycetaceae bacterium]|nr:Planctomycete cytochrome [Planctomycetaceae bacterium]
MKKAPRFLRRETFRLVLYCINLGRIGMLRLEFRSWFRRSIFGVIALAQWVCAGLANEPEQKQPFPAAADYDAFVKISDRDHWSFKAVIAPPIPTVKQREWVRNPIDAFVLAKLEAQAWSPNPPALPHQLLRRMHLDLTGLPPTLQEQVENSEITLDRLVDDLLSRPAYGERWGRHWLDLVRYAETNGYERDGTKPNVWRYRDYVIQAFNSDKPYDRFILEQLAGDELAARTTETVIATGYYRLGPWDDEPADPKEDRYDQLEDMVSTTSQVFLGLTLGCARCHNHKFEPFSTLDYYRMAAIFNTLQRPQNGRSDQDYPAGSRDQLADEVKRDQAIQQLQLQINAKRDAFRTSYLASAKSQSKLSAMVLDAFRTAPDKRNEDQKKLVQQHQAALDQELAAALPAAIQSEIQLLLNQQAAARQALPDLPRGYFYVEPGVNPPVTHVLLRGKSSAPGVVAEPGLPSVLVPQQPEFTALNGQTTGRRLKLAKWLASSQNSLTARVLVNRVWQFHFGEGLVRSPSDFGVMGSDPTHPELLDWLADWFVHDGQWSIKKLHRLIMLSNTYRMSKAWNPAYGMVDPANERLWRFPYRRMEVEPLCDSMLAVSGQLNRQMFGPSMYPAVPRQALEGHSDPNAIWKPFDERDASRRTVYTFIKRSLVVPLLEVLDLCDTVRSSAQRNITSVAPQALTLLNGDFVNRQSVHFSKRLEREAGSAPKPQIELAWRLAFCREPTTLEMTSMLTFLDQETLALQKSRPGITEAEARHLALVQMCRAIFNLNEFAYAD